MLREEDDVKDSKMGIIGFIGTSISTPSIGNQKWMELNLQFFRRAMEHCWKDDLRREK